MPSNPKRPGTNAGNTFTKQEIDGVVQLLDKLHRGEDVRVLLRQPPIANLYAKFKRMQGKLDRIQRDRLLSTPTPIVVEGDYD